jgi:DNA-binding PucR family transcriptional regulator
VTTLARYLDCGGNYDATAAALALGRSTVRYRLGRIRQISGRDLTDPDTRFQLQLATRAWVSLRALSAG